MRRAASIATARSDLPGSACPMEASGCPWSIGSRVVHVEVIANDVIMSRCDRGLLGRVLTRRARAPVATRVTHVHHVARSAKIATMAIDPHAVLAQLTLEQKVS